MERRVSSMSRLANTSAGTVAAVLTLGECVVSSASPVGTGAKPGIAGKSSVCRDIVDGMVSTRHQEDHDVVGLFRGDS